MPGPQEIRRAILAAPFELDNMGEIPHPGTLYIPPAHRKALSRDAVLVVGARGVGKSFWTAALSDEALRQQVGEAVQELATTRIHVGFAAKPAMAAYPDIDTFQQLLAVHESYSIWRAVLARWLAGIAGYPVPAESWSASVDWVEHHPEPFAKIVELANDLLAGQDQLGLIVFDALDRTSHDWNTMNGIVKDLLRVALWLRDFSRLRAKVFLRPDQLDRTVTAFADASKILATRADLTWERNDLHAMMWQRLINAPGNHGENLRQVIASIVGAKDGFHADGEAWRLAPSLTAEAPYQRPLFEALAGDKMGKDARRGVPYVWSVGHLADGHGSTSPRSFIAAIHSAAEDSLRRYADHPLPFHYESLKRGIRKASQIRVDQVAEDDPWVPEVMKPLRGLNVPIEHETIVSHWNTAFPNGPSELEVERLPPQHFERGWDGVRQDLERLGIFVQRPDRRTDLPDLYRVGFGLGRKGGVRPGN